MYHNFKFISSDSSITFFGYNPTSVSFGRKKRSTIEVLDSIQKVHYQDTTTVIGSFLWEAIPTAKNSYYNQILGLAGKSGTLYTSAFPRLVGRKNLIRKSTAFFDTDTWVLGCDGDLYSDGTTLSPDGISLAHKITTGAAATDEGCIAQSTSDPLETLQEHNVFSVYVKEGDAARFSINIYDNSLSTSHRVWFIWNAGVPELDSLYLLYEYGIESVGNGWYRVWCYYNPTTDIGNDIQVRIYPHSEYSSDGGAQEGTYIWGAQLEFDVDSPTYYVRTEGDAVDEPLTIEFLDYVISQRNTFGLIKHDILLNFKLTGTFI